MNLCNGASCQIWSRRIGEGGRSPGVLEQQRTSSSVFALSRIQPISITSAESFVTYTPCSSQVVAT